MAKEYATLIALFSLEHLSMCVPLATLLANLRHRHRVELAPNFEMLPEEAEGMASAAALLATGVASSLLVTPALQVALLALFYGWAHPWSGLFNHVVLKEGEGHEGGKDKEEEEEEEEETLPDEWYSLFEEYCTYCVPCTTPS